MGKKKTADLISVPAAAKIIGLSRRRVLSLVKEGRIPSTPVPGHGFLIERAAAEAFKDIPRRPGRPAERKEAPAA